MVIFVVVLSVYFIASKEVVVNAGGSRKVGVIHSDVGANIRSLPDAGSAVVKTARYAEQFTLLDGSDKSGLRLALMIQLVMYLKNWPGWMRLRIQGRYALSYTRPILIISGCWGWACWVLVD